MDILPGKICAPVEPPGVSENQRQPRLRHHGHFIAPMHLRKPPLAFLRRKSHPHPARNRNHPIRGFHARKFHLQPHAPRQTRWLASQPPTPPQRRLKFVLPRRNLAQNVFRRQRSRSHNNPSRAQSNPSEQRKNRRGPKPVAQRKQQSSNQQEENAKEGNP